MSFMKEFFDDKQPSDTLDLRKENAELRSKIENLEKIIADLKEKLNFTGDNTTDSVEDGNSIQQSSH
nr:hypothetical transcript [Hymenolepis microstoma]